MIEQLSVFLQNEPGKLAGITAALAEAGVDLAALSIADTADFGVLRMLVSDIGRAKAVLKNQNCILSATPVTVVAVPDEPGGLAGLLKLLKEQKINLEYMYSLIGHVEKKAYMVLRVSDGTALHNCLRTNGFDIITQEELGLR